MLLDPRARMRMLRPYSIRLRGYDSTHAGVYFVTIVTPQRACTFHEMRLCEIGETVAAGWTGLPDDCRNIELDESIVMPNHLHGIAVIVREPALTAITKMDMEGEPQPCASQI